MSSNLIPTQDDVKELINGKRYVRVVLEEPAASTDKAVRYDGANDHSQFGNVSILNLDWQGEFALGGWYKRFETATAERCPFSKQGGSNSAGWRPCLMADQWRLHLSGGSGSNRQEYRSSITGSTGTGYYFFLWNYRYNAGSKDVEFWVGNVNTGLFQKDPSITVQNNTLSSSISTTVGFQINGRNGTVGTMEGLVAHTYVFNKAFSDAEAEELWNNGKMIDISTHSVVVADPNDLLHAGNANNAIYTQHPDISVYGNNGVMTNFNAGQDQIVNDVP